MSCFTAGGWRVWDSGWCRWWSGELRWPILALGFLSHYNKGWQLARPYNMKLIMANFCLNWLINNVTYRTNDRLLAFHRSVHSYKVCKGKKEVFKSQPSFLWTRAALCNRGWRKWEPCLRWGLREGHWVGIFANQASQGNRGGWTLPPGSQPSVEEGLTATVWRKLKIPAPNWCWSFSKDHWKTGSPHLMSGH